MSAPTAPRRAVLLAASLLWLVPRAGAHCMEGMENECTEAELAALHAQHHKTVKANLAPVQTLPTTPVSTSPQARVAGEGAGDDFDAPAGRCQNQEGACYTPDQLARIRQKMIAGHDDATQVINDGFARLGQGADVDAGDLKLFDSFVHREEAVKDEVKTFRRYGVSEDQINQILDDPSQLRSVIRSLPPDQRRALFGARRYLSELMNNAMSGDNKNPFHNGLMLTTDKWARWATHPDRPGGGGGGDSQGAGTGMSGGQWQQADPNNPAAYVDGAQEAAAAGDLHGAVAQASKALRLDPNNLEALDLRAAANYNLHDMDAARADAQRALTLNANDQTADAVMKLANNRALGASSAQMAAISSALEARSASGGPQGSDGVVGALYGAAIQTPGMTNASAALLRDAMGAIANGSPDRAIRMLDRLIAENPNNLQALNLRAMALLRSRRYGEALADAEEGLRRSPKNRALMDTRAAALNKLHRFREAAEQARDALAQNPQDAAAWRALSEALAGLGDRAGSLDALKHAAALDPQHFQKTLETAVQLPSDADLSLLFADDLAGASAAAPASRSGPGARQLKRFGLVIGAALAAGLLMVLGLLPALKKHARQAWTRITRRGPSVAPPARRATDPLVKGQYRPIRQIGFGGMGMVYEGLDVNLQRPVAIKKMRDEIKLDARERARFMQEAKLVAALHHPAIVDIYAIAEEGDDVYLVFEYIKGKTLYDHVVERGRLRLDEALPILQGAVEGLEFAHSRGIIHRDLKPSNIMLNEEGRVKVMDFGIARVAKDAMTRASQVMTNTIVGTPPYMAPEQEQGLVRKESDTYALALCLYEMLTGRMAFAGTGAGMLMSKINKAYAPVTTLAPELPAEIDAVFSAVLEPEPGKRLATPRELLERVKAVAAGKRA